jgi:hypothetical protein
MLLRIYSNQACTEAVTSIDWGSLSPGTTKNVVVHARNEGTTPVTLTKALSNFNPTTMSTYLTLNWDYTNLPVLPGTTLKITLSLIVSPSISGITNFSFDTTITATG